MGVPAFFRWLTKKYPSVIVHCIEEKNKTIDGTDVPLDTTEPNPNGVEFDNLYLDMNGIIHPCTHPEDKPAPKNEDEMMVAIFECIDRLFRIVRPRKVLYMAIDGVAPRAKMNQQRSRRFRASKETSEKIKEVDRVREELISKGCEVPPAKEKGEHFDSNCITPGTPFMDRLSKCLHYYIHDRLNNDPGWRNVKVFLSDANVPGEGEHKIMDFIRRQRAQPDHDPNTAHVLCGADADLIMLGLASHEPNFTIIREEFKPNKPRPCDICGQVGHEMKDCLGLEKEVCGEHDEISAPFAAEVEFIFVRLNVLREYLEKELHMPNLPFPFELERAVDDWVFMCFFVGNDFLPHLPSLEIREGAIDRLVELYKKTVYKTGGWLSDSGIPDLSRVQLILSDLGEVEDEIFKNRQHNELKFKDRLKAQKRRKQFEQQANSNCYSRPAYLPHGQFAPMAIGNNPNAIHDAKNEAFNMRRQGMHMAVDSATSRSNTAAAAALKSMLTESSESPKSDSGVSSVGMNDDSLNSSGSSSCSPSPSPSPASSPFHGTKRPHNDDSDEETNDEVRLWEDGFKDRYYESKFDVAVDNFKFRNEVAAQYVRGLCWVLRYYYQGCASWKWYFPYHYAPFASDFINVGDLSTEFEKATQPFKPLEQLMGVFPAASRSHVPAPWGELMLDPESSIIDFYPEDFQIDLNGKKFAWQGVALLPFVDEVRLKKALESCYALLTEDEKKRNIRGDDRMYVLKGHKGYDFVHGLYENNFDSNTETNLDPQQFDSVAGTVLVSDDRVPEKGQLKSPINGLLDIDENYVACIRYRDPKYADDYIFPAKRLEGAKDPPKVLKPGDLTPEQNRNWRPMVGMTHSNQRASLGHAGHRMMANEGYSRDQRGGGQYSNMPPPNNSGPYRSDRSFHQNRYQPYNANDRRGGGHYNQRDGGSWNNSGRGGHMSRGGGYSNHYEDRGYSNTSNNNGSNRNNNYYQSQQPYGGYFGGSSSGGSQQQGGRPWYGSGFNNQDGGSASNRRGDRYDQQQRGNERGGGRRQEGSFSNSNNRR